MDIRNPKLDEYITIPNLGLTNFLSSKKEVSEIHDFIVKSEERDDYYVLPAGIIPPNPAELLMNERVVQLLDYLKKEIGLVSKLDSSPSIPLPSTSVIPTT